MHWLDLKMNDEPKSKYLDHRIYYVCRECALSKQATPKDGIHTHHIGICDLCQKEKDICAKRNWKWPLERYL
jgi:hypothetical protein